MKVRIFARRTTVETKEMVVDIDHDAAIGVMALSREMRGDWASLMLNADRRPWKKLVEEGVSPHVGNLMTAVQFEEDDDGNL